MDRSRRVTGSQEIAEMTAPNPAGLFEGKTMDFTTEELKALTALNLEGESSDALYSAIAREREQAAQDA